jgi:hypothetical protein
MFLDLPNNDYPLPASRSVASSVAFGFQIFSVSGSQRFKLLLTCDVSRVTPQLRVGQDL